MTYKFHPLSELFPMMPSHEIDELAQDIKERGLQLSIALYHDQILDGRCRYLACRRIKMVPRTVVVNPPEGPLAYVVSRNIHRRHLTPGERATAIAKIMLRVNPSNEGEGDILTQEKAAEIAGVGVATIERAVKAEKETKPGPKPKPKKPKKPKPSDDEDALGNKIPPLALVYWKRRSEVTRLVKMAGALEGALKECIQDDPMWKHLNLESLASRVHSVKFEISNRKPYAVCPVCQGKKPETCQMCKGAGLLCKEHYDVCVPVEAKP